MEIQYKAGIIPSTEEIIAVYESSTIKRPTNDSERITAMYKNSNLVVTAWDGEELVGISRSITDFHYCCYLSDLAVKMKYQHQGIGKKLIAITKEKLGPQVMLLLLAAVDYYPKIGMEKFDHAFMIHREK